ncbi:hypothetical protein CVT26_016029 [Gymnopilus dilepis]|uniref:Uncharacterized protein n=1 Tax=Gymnopilus dilepis TaxID=231916 RepID=A0A409WMH6_9AGAR|nr:hypothetical protein CVT26_016029 [Gymnopilus dilepis]
MPAVWLRQHSEPRDSCEQWRWRRVVDLELGKKTGKELGQAYLNTKLYRGRGRGVWSVVGIPSSEASIQTGLRSADVAGNSKGRGLYWGLKLGI